MCPWCGGLKLSWGIVPGVKETIEVNDQDSVVFVSLWLSVTEIVVSVFVDDFTHEFTSGVLQRVRAMPRQGVSSTFKFGTSYGFCRGLLVSFSVPFEDVTPWKWQRELKCLSKGDKNVTKAAAQRLFPDQKVVHATADAMLLAEYARRFGRR